MSDGRHDDDVCGEIGPAETIALLQDHIRHLEEVIGDLHERSAEAAHLQRTTRALAEGWGTEAARRAAAAEGEIARLRAEIDALHRSTSWRITAPIRWLRRRIGGS